MLHTHAQARACYTPRLKWGFYIFRKMSKLALYTRGLPVPLNPVKLYNPSNAHLKHVLRLFSACLDKIFILLNEAPKTAVSVSARRLYWWRLLSSLLIALTSRMFSSHKNKKLDAVLMPK